MLTCPGSIDLSRAACCVSALALTQRPTHIRFIRIRSVSISSLRPLSLLDAYSETLSDPMTSNAHAHLDKARQFVALAGTLLKKNYNENAAIDAYLAAYHAARAYILECRGEAPRIEEDVQAQFTNLVIIDPRVDEGCRSIFWSAEGITLGKARDLAEDAEITSAEAKNAVRQAAHFVEHIGSIIAPRSNPPPGKE